MKLRTVGYQQDTEIVTFTKSCWSMRCKKPGIDVEYLNMALRLAGLEAEVDPFDHPVTEALSLIVNGSADMTVHAIVQNADRLKRVDFTVPVNYVVYGYLAREVEEMKVKEFIINALCPEVILFLVLGLISSPLAMWIFSGYSRSYRGWLFHSLRTLLKQDTHLRKRYTLANAFLMIAWIWFCFFFTLYFESAMKSTLTLSAKKGYEFQNLDGLLNAIEKKGWKLVVQDEIGWNPMDFCKPAHNQCNRLQRAVRQAIHIPRGVDPYLSIPPQSVLFAALHSHSVPADVVYISRDARLLFIKDSTLNPGILSYAVNKDLPKVLEKINKALEKIQGSYTNFAARYAAPYIPYFRLNGYSEFFELRLIYLWPLFRLCIGAIGVSIGVFFIEIFMGGSGFHLHLLSEECRCEDENLKEDQEMKIKGSRMDTNHHWTRNSLISFFSHPLFTRKRSQYSIKDVNQTIQ